MFLIAGLGNPGRKYDQTKHNMGFDAVTELVDRWNIPGSGTDMKAMYGKGLIGGQKVMLIKPMTYMNLSGEAIRAYCHYYKVDPESELLVIYDDISLDPGQLRIRKKGSAGGHNGIKNIVQQLGTDKFARIRIGIGAKPEGWDLADYVLGRFPKEELETMRETVGRAVDATEEMIRAGADSAMNKFN
jgi:PTH1 family peptidyl-tRNA hydrolase